MSEQQQKPKSFMEELDAWTEANIASPLFDAAYEHDESESPEIWPNAVEEVQKAIRAKVLESYRNGQKAGPAACAKDADGEARMKLLTQEILHQLPPLGTDADDPMVWAKFFTPDGGWTWYAVEGQRDLENDDFVFFGYVVGPFPEWGEFRLSELANVRGALGLPVERDLHFRPRRFGELNLPINIWA